MKIQKKQESAYSPGTSILWKVSWQALLLTTFVIVVLTTVAFFISRTLLERSVYTQLTSVAAIAEDALDSTLYAHRERAAILTSHQDVRSILRREAGQNTLNNLLNTLRNDQSALLGIEVYGSNGETLASAGDAIGLLPEEARSTPYYRPVITKTGWDAYQVFAPVRDRNEPLQGYLALHYDARTALTPLLAVVPSLGASADVVLVRPTDTEIQLIHPSTLVTDQYILTVNKDDNLTILQSIKGMESVARGDDYLGRDSLVAFRYLPTLGWGIAVQVERSEALAEVRRLAAAHSSIGTMLLMLATALASMLAHQVTNPLRSLTTRVKALQPGQWDMKRSVYTDDEVEVLDRVMVDMAGRLKKVYEEQEEIIADRTNELRLQYELDRAILETIEFGVLTISPEGLITGSNPAAVRMLEIAEVDKAIGTEAAALVQIRTHGGKKIEGEHPVAQCLQRGKTVHGSANEHFNLARKDDTMLPVAYIVSPLFAGKKLLGAILTLQDVSEERRLDYLKSEFISLASHQLRTPLSAIRWYTELFAEEKNSFNKDQKGYLNEMQTSIKRMISLLNSLLHAARLESSNLEPDIQEVEMVALVKETAEDSSIPAKEAGVGLKLDLPKKKIDVKTDPTLLRIVMQNLVTNALKYTSHNEKKSVHIKLKETAKQIEIQVIDQGWGIPKAEQKRVFQRFFRAKNVRKRDTDGNGLGLYITHTIVERLGGSISFTSEEDKGTTFTVKLKK